jgi:flagellin
VASLDVSNAAGGAYTFGATGAALSVGNGTRVQTITVADLSAAGTQTLNFNTLGISITLQATNAALGATMAAAVGTANTLAVTGGAVASLGFQIGASPTVSGDSIAIGTLNVSTISSNMASLTNTGNVITKTSGTDGLANLATNTTATDALWNTAFKALQGYVTTAINDISSSRATLGANMNQLGFIDQTLQAQSANEQAARSTIVDTNFSAETARLTKGQIMQQAATAMLAQANQMPNVILSLLK